MKLWLDDIREPWKYGHVGVRWAKTADEAIELLKTGEVEWASLDHDLTEQDTIGIPSGAKTGYDVVCWMEENDVWPKTVLVHSMNPAGRARMEAAIRRHYER